MKNSCFGDNTTAFYYLSWNGKGNCVMGVFVLLFILCQAVNSCDSLCCGQKRHKLICPQRAYDAQGRFKGKSTSTWDSDIPEATWGTIGLGNSLPEFLCCEGEIVSKGGVCAQSLGIPGHERGTKRSSQWLFFRLGMWDGNVFYRERALQLPGNMEGWPALQFCVDYGQALIHGESRSHIRRGHSLGNIS